jgi:D-alanine--poly(phosphoribitol) ligase subunit 1
MTSESRETAQRLGTDSELYWRVREISRPDRVAMVSPTGSLTYAELFERAHELALNLAGRRSPILVYGHKDPALLVAFVAALEVGRPYVPVDVSAPVGRIERMLDLAHPGDVVVAGPLPPELAAVLDARGVAAGELDRLGRLTRPEMSPVAGADSALSATPLAYVMFTSGTTGDPKGVPIPVSALTNFADWILGVAGCRPNAETFLNQAPFNFDLSIMDVYGSLLSGGTLFSITRDEIGDPRALFRRLEHASLTVWVSTPSFARLCLAEPRFRAELLPALRCFLFCGETLPPEVAGELLRRFPGAEVWNTYGPTETTVAVTGVRITAELAASGRPLPVGTPAPNVEVYIVDREDASRRLPLGEVGEIVIAGRQVSIGYLLPPTAPGESERPNPFVNLPDGRRAYQTGDLGWLEPGSGQLYCAGRTDRQVKVRGYRLELEEIESLLRRMPGVGEAAVLVVDRDGHPDHLVAFLVPAGDPEQPALPEDDFDLGQAARSFLADRLPSYALPRRTRLIRHVPLTSNGKLDRRALAQLVTR